MPLFALKQPAFGVAAAIIAAVVVVDVAWLSVGTLTIDVAFAVRQLVSTVAMVGCLMLVARFVRRRLDGDDSRVALLLKRFAECISPIAVCGALMALFCISGEILSYLAATLALPLQDQALAAIDRALGLDWPAMIVWLTGHPLLAQALVTAYNSIFLQAPLVVLLLAVAGQHQRLAEFMGALVLAGTLTVIISALLPAAGAYTFHHIDPAGPSFAGPHTGIWYLAVFNGLRAGTLSHIDLHHLQGLIQFPSFHSALAALFAIYLGTIQLLRWPALAANGIMLAATLPIGGHHFADTLGGVAIAVLSVHAMRRLQAGRQQRAPLPAAA